MSIQIDGFGAAIALSLSLLWSDGAHARDKPIGILLAAGDIATCATNENKSGKATADLIKLQIAKIKVSHPGVEVRVLALGDLAYDRGTAKSFDCFNATWGQFKDKILPVPGNHDYLTNNGAAFFKYFESTLKGLKADKKSAYYSVEFPTPSSSADNASWQILALNSNTGTGSSTQQVKWLVSELERTKSKRCVLAFSHAFYYSSGMHGHHDNPNPDSPLRPEKVMRPMFEALHTHRASLFLAGHDHHYEQLGRANAKGQPADRGQTAMVSDGVRSFVVGTGGKGLYPRDYRNKWTFTEAYDLSSYGVLRIELYPNSYRWEFLPTKPNTASMKIMRDIKTDTCNRP
ncbi:MAG: metallophosphoesterase [Bradyrhizobium sp.]|uniref:metallophosphoesterase family protein n=1 Tax=Bradyrhizobium sp. TaxID=376 RepID=UPI002730A3BF|nr:metallophosphoesterase [Bradyrhizobium sp.]MDP1868007.1 metallophosphoesterase [Bradyrhizobium sp.]